MRHTFTRPLLALLLLAACDEEKARPPTGDIDPTEGSSSTGDIEPTGTPTEGSSSSTGEPVKPDPRPTVGLFAHCEQDDELECPGAALVCFKDEVAWGTGPGVCTLLLCESVNDCIPEGGLPKSGAELRCTEITDGGLKACVLQCEEDDECPGAMVCLDLPSPQPGIQKICV